MPVKRKRAKFKAWFMHGDHTFREVKGTLKQIYDQLDELFMMDPDGGWGKLTAEGYDGYIIQSYQVGLEKLEQLIKEEKEGKFIVEPEHECKYCEEPVNILHSDICANCYSLLLRMNERPMAARKILNEIIKEPSGAMLIKSVDTFTVEFHNGESDPYTAA